MSNKSVHIEFSKGVMQERSQLISQGLSNLEKKERVAFHFAAIMETLGLDLEDPSLKKTPQRVAKMYVEEIFTGLDPSTFPFMSSTDIDEAPDSAEAAFIQCEFCTFCEHHFTPSYGTAYVAYIPKGKYIGLSKIPALVKYHSQRPQLQERLTLQIAESLMEAAQTNHVAVALNAQHFCMIARDSNCRNSRVVTKQLFGDFKNNPSIRQSFVDYIS